MGHRRTCGLTHRSLARGFTLSPSKGFTLIELLVTIAIMAIISLVIFSSQSKFDSTLVLANTTYDVALSMRDAETYGVASRALTSVADTGYGLEFSSIPSSQYIFFADNNPAPSTSGCHAAADPTLPDAKPGDCMYSAGLDQLVSNFALGNGMKVTNICEYDSSLISYCSKTSTITRLDITFTRPNTVANINGLNGNAVVPPGPNAIKGCVAISAPAGGTRSIIVWQTGEIEFHSGDCP